MKLLVEMALDRSSAIERCIGLGKQFIIHYDKLYKNPNNESREHWIDELENWFNSVKEIKLKSNNKPLLNSNLIDWFFTAGANAEDFMNNPTYDELEKYDNFIIDLLQTNSVRKSLNI